MEGIPGNPLAQATRLATWFIDRTNFPIQYQPKGATAAGATNSTASENMGRRSMATARMDQPRAFQGFQSCRRQGYPLGSMIEPTSPLPNSGGRGH